MILSVFWYVNLGGPEPQSSRKTQNSYVINSIWAETHFSILSFKIDKYILKKKHQWL